MAFIAGFGGTLTFSGIATGGGTIGTVPVRSFTMSFERASLDTTTLSDFRERRLPGRVRRSGTMTILRQTGSADDTLRAALIPADMAAATGAAASLTLKYADQGTIEYNEYGAGTAVFAVTITSATITDDGTGAAVWELSWEEQ
jgi:hypothetical protein